MVHSGLQSLLDSRYLQQEEQAQASTEDSRRQASEQQGMRASCGRSLSLRRQQYSTPVRHRTCVPTAVHGRHAALSLHLVSRAENCWRIGETEADNSVQYTQ
jgi:hypothetical protein